jgi:hypothetical protein
VASASATVNVDVLTNLVVTLHLAYFVFVTGGVLAILIGAKLRWHWVLNPWFRIAHLLSIFIVLAEDSFGVNCPLNVAEASLRSTEPKSVGASGGIGQVLDQLLHHTLSEKVLDELYWTLASLSILLLIVVRPRFARHAIGPSTPSGSSAR